METKQNYQKYLFDYHFYERCIFIWVPKSYNSPLDWNKNFLVHLRIYIGIMVKVSANGPGDRRSILRRHTKDLKNGTWCLLA